MKITLRDVKKIIGEAAGTRPTIHRKSRAAKLLFEYVKEILQEKVRYFQLPESEEQKKNFLGLLDFAVRVLDREISNGRTSYGDVKKDALEAKREAEAGNFENAFQFLQVFLPTLGVKGWRAPDPGEGGIALSAQKSSQGALSSRNTSAWI
jgi:hypothetical protein